MPKDDPRYLHSRAVVCNQVIYGKVSGNFKDADGNDIKLDNQPVIAYFKRSGFKPVADFIDGLSRQKKVMQKVVARLDTLRTRRVALRSGRQSCLTLQRYRSRTRTRN